MNDNTINDVTEVTAKKTSSKKKNNYYKCFSISVYINRIYSICNIGQYGWKRS